MLNKDKAGEMIIDKSPNDFYIYCANIEANIKAAQLGLNLLSKLKNHSVQIIEKDVGGDNYSDRLADILTQFIVLKTAGLFDPDYRKRSFSVENIIYEMSLTPMESQTEKFGQNIQDLKNSHSILIGRLQKNRNQSIAHNQIMPELGWSKIDIDKFEEEYGLSEEIVPVSESVAYLTEKNILATDIVALLNDLDKIIKKIAWEFLRIRNPSN